MRPPDLARTLARAADGIAAVQRALRTAQHLDPLKVREVPVPAHLAAQVHAVHANPHARIRRDQMVLRADAPDERIRGRGMPGGEHGYIQIRHKLPDVHQVRNAALRQFGAVEHA